LDRQTAQSELALANAVHQFIAGERDRCVPEALEAQHHSDTLLRAPMVLLNQVVQVLRWALSVFVPFSSANSRHLRQHSSCRQDHEDNRGFPHVPPTPHSGGHMFPHSGSASQKVSQFVMAAAVACR
jgi:hypothetical protein